MNIVVGPSLNNDVREIKHKYYPIFRLFKSISNKRYDNIDK